jgi:anti-sigma regulatory factor (Ser/Thr protein kinase)
MIVTKAFTFDNQPENITQCSRTILGYLEPLLTQLGQARALLLRAKFIVGELLNNAVKHSGTNHTEVTVTLNDKTLTISKIDTGAPFDLVSEIEKQDAQLIVSSDAMHLLYAIKKDESTVSFFCKENLTFELDVNKLAEHLGLLIITKAADEFTYHYQKPTNIFTVKLNLGR